MRRALETARRWVFLFSLYDRSVPALIGNADRLMCADLGCELLVRLLYQPTILLLWLLLWLLLLWLLLLWPLLMWLLLLWPLLLWPLPLWL